MKTSFDDLDGAAMRAAFHLGQVFTIAPALQICSPDAIWVFFGQDKAEAEDPTSKKLSAVHNFHKSLSQVRLALGAGCGGALSM